MKEFAMSAAKSREDRSTGPFDLSQTPIHLGSRVDTLDPAVPLVGFGFDGPSFESYIAAHCAPGSPGRLIMVESTPGDWPAWECHTQGDEIVIVLEGKADFIQEIDGEERRIAVGPGSTVLNPAGVWHTADVEVPMKAIYITPCPGTESRKR
jgi:mannose-6-phosphate isomerase-like protein (cupin superfamily)